MSTRQDMHLGIRTLEALARIVNGSVTIHSDQDTLYTHANFRRRAAEHNIEQSYSRKGNCWDNAVMESWNGTLKTEWHYHPDKRFHKQLLTVSEARREILKYCAYYNEKRIQVKLNYRSPMQFREAVAHQF